MTIIQRRVSLCRFDCAQLFRQDHSPPGGLAAAAAGELAAIGELVQYRMNFVALAADRAGMDGQGMGSGAQMARSA
jgi:hypothetical protein